jgi:hypothetical protein
VKVLNRKNAQQVKEKRAVLKDQKRWMNNQTSPGRWDIIRKGE